MLVGGRRTLSPKHLILAARLLRLSAPANKHVASAGTFGGGRRGVGAPGCGVQRAGAAPAAQRQPRGAAAAPGAHPGAARSLGHLPQVQEFRAVAAAPTP